MTHSLYRLDLTTLFCDIDTSTASMIATANALSSGCRMMAKLNRTVPNYQ